MLEMLWSPASVGFATKGKAKLPKGLLAVSSLTLFEAFAATWSYETGLPVLKTVNDPLLYILVYGPEGSPEDCVYSAFLYEVEGAVLIWGSSEGELTP